MGMTDSQFKSYLRFVIKDLEEAVEEKDPEKKEKLLNKILKILHRSMED